MSSVLYRPGKGTIENGVECESVTVDHTHVPAMLDAGWSVTPPGAEENRSVKVEHPEDEVTFDNAKDPGRIANELEKSAITGYDEQQVQDLVAQSYENGVAAGKSANTGELYNLRDEVKRLTASEANLRAQLAAYQKAAYQNPGDTNSGSPEGGDSAITDQVTPDQQALQEQEDHEADKEGETLDIDNADVDAIRQAAKDAGIDGWESKRVKTLRAELKAKKEA